MGCLYITVNLQRNVIFWLPLIASLCLFSAPTMAGRQSEEPLSASVKAALSKAISDRAAPQFAFSTDEEAKQWLNEMSLRLQKRMPDPALRLDFLKTVHYEALRAGLDPQLVLGLIQVESGFKKYAVSRAKAMGYMQVMPFWVTAIGSAEQNLFHLRTNLRYGCTILRHYLDIEKGDYFRALGRYNGSLGRAEYPTLVVNAWQNFWSYPDKIKFAEIHPKSGG